MVTFIYKDRVYTRNIQSVACPANWPVSMEVWRRFIRMQLYKVRKKLAQYE